MQSLGMTVTNEAIDRSATDLLAAERDRTDRAPLTDTWQELDLQTAYRIQDETLRRRLDRGEQLVGIKLGLTSLKKQQQMKVDSPLTAWLTDAMLLPAGKPLPQAQLIHPRVEPEIVFVMRERLAGPGVTAADALAAVDHVLCGLEVIDSRYTDFRFTLPDVVADNASAACYVTGSVRLPATGLDLVAEACTLKVDGEPVATATGADVQGHPAEALAVAANALAARGHAIEAGWTVLTGGMTDAVFATAGSHIEVRFTNLGSITLRC
jgi:2-oxo-3-hexenedioate decarboxylase